MEGLFSREAETVERRAADILVDFHKLFYYRKTWSKLEWLGTPCYKSPADMMIQQMVLAKVRPSLVVETGTAHGGSALFFATVLQALGTGRVITVDLTPYPRRPAHPLIEYVTGSSTDPAVFAPIREAAEAAAASGPVIVILDSLHTRDHVAAELDLYADLVTPGSFLIVEDTNMNGHPVHTDFEPEFGPGPMEALQRFLGARSDFKATRVHEMFLFSHNPFGYLVRG